MMSTQEETHPPIPWKRVLIHTGLILVYSGTIAFFILQLYRLLHPSIDW